MTANHPRLRVRTIPTILDGYGPVVRTYEWEGDPTAPILLAPRTAADLPWPMALVEQYIHMREGWYIRLDVRGAWYRRGWLIAARRAVRAWDWFTTRCVLTLHIWGLARYETGRQPSWRDVGFRRKDNA